MKKVAKLLGGGADSDTEMMKVFALENSLATVNEFFYRVHKCELVFGCTYNNILGLVIWRKRFDREYSE